MYDFGLSRNLLTVLAALLLALVMTFLPNGSAFAGDEGSVEFTIQDSSSDDRALLRHLLTQADRDALEQRLLEHALDGVYEELADATVDPAPSEGKSFIKSVNDLLGVKTNKPKASS